MLRQHARLQEGVTTRKRGSVGAGWGLTLARPSALPRPNQPNIWVMVRRGWAVGGGRWAVGLPKRRSHSGDLTASNPQEKTY